MDLLSDKIFSMATLYSYTSTNNNTGWNWNGANDNGALSFTPTATGTPTQVVLRIATITGSPVIDLYIQGDKTIGSANYGSATGVSITAGTNTISISGGAQITSGTRYWIYIKRTSSISNYFNFYNEYTSPPTEQYWKSTASNIDPDSRYDSGVKNIGASMDVNGTLAGASANPAFLLKFV
jgi:hypothetical protein